VSGSPSLQEPVLVQIRFRVTPDDVADTLRANLLWRLTRPRTLLALMFMAVSISALVAVTGLTDGNWGIALPFVLLGLVMALSNGVVYLMMPTTARRTWRQQKSLQAEYDVTMTNGGLRAQTDTSDVFTAWDNYVAWQETRRILMVFQSELLFQFAPKSAFTVEQLKIARSLMAALPRR
jgi:lipopolysaccharide export LptBFGC system permease protein LptF